MDCQHSQPLLHGYLDGELDLVRSMEVEEHLQTCHSCAKDLERQQALRALICASALYERAPATLRARIESSLPRATRSRSGRGRRLWQAGSVAAAAALVALATWAIMHRTNETAHEALIDQVVVSHIRSLLVDHASDVASSDRHQVKPWFNGKLDYAPQVIDLSESGFPLMGGRLDYLHHQPVAALIYMRRKHVINLFCWPSTATGDLGIEDLTRQGYQIVRWTQGNLDFWAISDLNADELRQFAQLVQAGGAPDHTDPK